MNTNTCIRCDSEFNQLIIDVDVDDCPVCGLPAGSDYPYPGPEPTIDELMVDDDMPF